MDGKKKIYDLPAHCLQNIVSYMDTKTSLKMLYSNKKVYSKLVDCTFFWKHLCVLEGFDKVSSLSDEEVNKDDKDRVTWSGELLHSNRTSEEATRWQKVYQRGIQMRRNLAEGKCELWRLFMTDHRGNLPVRKMTQDTQQEDLKILDRLSAYQDPGRSAEVFSSRFWNEEFLVMIQIDYDDLFHDVYVWKWEQCQKPVFLYKKNLLSKFPMDFSESDSCFLHKNYFVCLPDTEKQHQASIVWVHDLSNGFKVVKKFDCDTEVRQFNKRKSLVKFGDKAVALCWTPYLTFHIISLPHCTLEKTIKIKDQKDIGNP